MTIMADGGGGDSHINWDSGVWGDAQGKDTHHEFIFLSGFFLQGLERERERYDVGSDRKG